MTTIEIDPRRERIVSPPDGTFRAPAPCPVLSRAETAECNCPDYCDRDHANE
jgi:hypothetical protein